MKLTITIVKLSVGQFINNVFKSWFDYFRSRVPCSAGGRWFERVKRRALSSALTQNINILVFDEDNEEEGGGKGYGRRRRL